MKRDFMGMRSAFHCDCPIHESIRRYFENRMLDADPVKFEKFRRGLTVRLSPKARRDKPREAREGPGQKASGTPLAPDLLSFIGRG